jgi:hypothetical protein
MAQCLAISSILFSVNDLPFMPFQIFRRCFARRSFFTEDYSTKFAPWLAFGCLSPRKIFEQIREYEKEQVVTWWDHWGLRVSHQQDEGLIKSKNEDRLGPETLGFWLEFDAFTVNHFKVQLLDNDMKFSGNNRVKVKL